MRNQKCAVLCLARSFIMPPARRLTSSHQAALRALTVVDSKTRKAILQSADKPLIYALCEIALNFLSGHIPVSTANKRKLEKYKSQLRRLARKGESWQEKKRVVQRGGGFFIPLLLSVLGPAIGQLIFGSK